MTFKKRSIFYLVLYPYLSSPALNPFICDNSSCLAIVEHTKKNILLWQAKLIERTLHKPRNNAHLSNTKPTTATTKQRCRPFTKQQKADRVDQSRSWGVSTALEVGSGWTANSRRLGRKIEPRILTANIKPQTQMAWPQATQSPHHTHTNK